MLLCGFFWRSNRNHYLLVLVMRALATSISMYVRTYRNSIIELRYYDTYRGTMEIIFTVNILFVLGQNMTPIWK